MATMFPSTRSTRCTVMQTTEVDPEGDTIMAERKETVSSGSATVSATVAVVAPADNADKPQDASDKQDRLANVPIKQLDDIHRDYGAQHRIG